jgi:hypothetical protein
MLSQQAYSCLLEQTYGITVIERDTHLEHAA